MSFWYPKFSKKQWNIWWISALEYKKCHINKIKTPSYNIWYNLHIICIKVIIMCLYLYDLTTFYILRQKFLKFFVGFLENLRYQKDILKLRWFNIRRYFHVVHLIKRIWQILNFFLETIKTFLASISFWVKIGNHSRFNPECNTERCYIVTVYSTSNWNKGKICTLFSKNWSIGKIKN